MIERHRLHEARVHRRELDRTVTFAIEPLPAPDGIAALALVGELDMAAAPSLRSRIDESLGMRAVVVDLSGATFVDSSLLKELLRGDAELARAGARLVVCSVSPAVKRLLDLTRTAELLTLAEDLEAGIRRADA